MKVLLNSILLFLFLSVFAFSNNAANIENGYKALKIYNYFEAKRVFYKNLKKDSSSAAFGLATIYYRKDNPFHSLDSAFLYVQVAERNYNTTPVKTRDKLFPYGFEHIEIVRLRDSISTIFFNQAVDKNTVLCYDNFIELHPWAKEKFRAIYKRDAILFKELKEKNKSFLYKEFVDNHPGSHFVRLAQTEYELSLFKEMTVSGDLEDYVNFIRLHPNNRYVKDAEDKVYRLSTIGNEVIDFKCFIERFPYNSNVKDAWRKLYQLYMIDYSDERAVQFKQDFPKYPFQYELEQDIKFAQRNLLPIKKGDFFGAMNYQGELILEANYDYLGFFNEGLAVAVRKGRYGFIDKGKNVIIDFLYDEAFDFEGGRAIVSLNDKLGVIDRTGKAILPIEFEDVGGFSDGLTYALKDSLYGYFDKSGSLRIEERFEEAFSFNKGVAKVQVDGKQAYIDVYGTYVVEPKYEKVRFFTDSLVVYLEQGKVGIADIYLCPIDSIQYDFIGELNDDLAIVSSDRKVGYIDSTGKLVIEMVYDEFPNFMERGVVKASMAIASKKGKYGVIGKDGNQILPFRYLKIGQISALTAFTKGKGWGFFDLAYDIKIKPSFDYAESFREEFAIVQKDNKWGVIDTSGVEIIPTEYETVDRMLDFAFIVTDSNKAGLIDVCGYELIPIVYNQIRYVKEDVLLLLKDKQMSYYHIPTNEIIYLLKEEDE
jgi:hypothetical protein